MLVVVSQSNGTGMIVIIKEEAVSVEVVMVMEGANIFPVSAETVPL